MENELQNVPEHANISDPSGNWTSEAENPPVAEETQAGTSAESETANTESEEQRPRKNKMDRRIGKLLARESAAIARAQELEDRLRAYGEELPVVEQAVNDVDEEHSDHTEEHQNQTVHAPEQVEVLQNFQRSAQESRGKYADFDQVVGKSDVSLPDPALVALGELENVADVAYHLAKNPHLAQELWQMTPTKAVAAIGRISAQLERQAEPQISKAPKPISPVSKSSPSLSGELHDGLDPKEWVKRRERQIAANR